eukprot:11361713-Alexandrium_andersonii.AAC.1
MLGPAVQRRPGFCGKPFANADCVACAHLKSKTHTTSEYVRLNATGGLTTSPGRKACSIRR